MKKSFLALALFASSSVATSADDAYWGYEGKAGPDNWGNLNKEFATCKLGQQQAPIDIPTKSAAKTAAPIKTNYKASSGEVINNGHTIQVTLPDAGGANLSGVNYHVNGFSPPAAAPPPPFPPFVERRRALLKCQARKARQPSKAS